MTSSPTNPFQIAELLNLEAFERICAVFRDLTPWKKAAEDLQKLDYDLFFGIRFLTEHAVWPGLPARRRPLRPRPTRSRSR